MGRADEHGVKPAVMAIAGGSSTVSELPAAAGNSSFGFDGYCCAMTDKGKSGSNFRKTPSAKMLAGLCHD